MALPFSEVHSFSCRVQAMQELARPYAGYPPDPSRHACLPLPSTDGNFSSCPLHDAFESGIHPWG